MLHCPTAVGGHPPMLARAERELGLESRAIVLEPPRFGYPVDEVMFAAGAGPTKRELARWRLLVRALREFDVVHFNFGSSLLPRYYPPSVTGGGLGRSLYGIYARAVQLRDLPILKRAGKAIVVTYQGDDARQAAALAQRPGLPFPPELLETYYNPELDRRKRNAIATFDRYADAIFFLNPDLLDVLPARAEFLPYASVDPAEWRPVETVPEAGAPPVVVHAPSDRIAKGTRFLLDAVDELRGRGVELELQLVEGVDNAEARRLYARADVLVDQLVSGWYGSVAVELMALGKPVVAYLNEDDLARIPHQMRSELPVLGATPATLADVLEEWLTKRRGELGDVGRRSRAYVERWHDPRHVAARTKEVYERIVSRR